MLACKNRDIIKRNMAALPAYSLLLGLIALLGYMAIAAGVMPQVVDGKADPSTVVPLLFDKMFPSWFAGIAYAAIGIGALVPAAIMSIAAANLFTRNIYVEYLRPKATPAEEARVSKLASLVVKLGALLFIVAIDPQFSIDLQLIGGVIILQTLPSVGLGLFTRWFHKAGLIAGWIAGMGAGLCDALRRPRTRRPTTRHFGGSAFALDTLGLPWHVAIYAGFLAVAVNLVVGVIAHLDRARRQGAPTATTRPWPTTTSPTRAIHESCAVPPRREDVRRPATGPAVGRTADTRGSKHARLRLALRLQVACDTMGNENVVDAILPILQRIQAELAAVKAELVGMKAELKTSVARLDTRLDETNAQLAAFKDMTEARFIAIEHVLLDVSARAHMASQLERRVTAIETRLDEPTP